MDLDLELCVVRLTCFKAGQHVMILRGLIDFPLFICVFYVCVCDNQPTPYTCVMWSAHHQ